VIVVLLRRKWWENQCWLEFVAKLYLPVVRADAVADGLTGPGVDQIRSGYGLDFGATFRRGELPA